MQERGRRETEMEKKLKRVFIKVINWDFLTSGSSQEPAECLRALLTRISWEKHSSMRAPLCLVEGYSTGIVSVFHPPLQYIRVVCQFLGILVASQYEKKTSALGEILSAQRELKPKQNCCLQLLLKSIVEIHIPIVVGYHEVLTKDIIMFDLLKIMFKNSP